MAHNNFHDCLKEQRFVPEKKIPFYTRWGSIFLNSCGDVSGQLATDEHIETVIKDFACRHEEWQRN